MSRLLVLSRENPYKSLGFIVKLPPELNLEGAAIEVTSGGGGFLIGEGVVATVLLKYILKYYYNLFAN
jgi:hypothetical protein